WPPAWRGAGRRAAADRTRSSGLDSSTTEVGRRPAERSGAHSAVGEIHLEQPPVAFGHGTADGAERGLGFLDDLAGVVDDAPAPAGRGGVQKCHHGHGGLLTRIPRKRRRRVGGPPRPPRSHEQVTRLPAASARAAATEAAARATAATGTPPSATRAAV